MSGSGCGCVGFVLGAASALTVAAAFSASHSVMGFLGAVLSVASIGMSVFLGWLESE